MLNITISGMDSVSAAIGSLTEAVVAGIETGVAEGASIVRDRARALCPVRTGALRNSISAESSGNKAEISAEKEYGVFVEFGTSKMSPKPFMVPALLESTEEITARIAEAIGERI